MESNTKMIIETIAFIGLITILEVSIYTLILGCKIEKIINLLEKRK